MIRFYALLLLLLIVVGCQRAPTGPVGGASGILRLGESPLADFQVKVFRQSDGVLQGTGATNWEGKFHLVASDGKTPFWLEPGDYVCVLESFGTDAPKLSAAYKDKTKSPLRLSWANREEQIELVLPVK